MKTNIKDFIETVKIKEEIPMQTKFLLIEGNEELEGLVAMCIDERDGFFFDNWATKDYLTRLIIIQEYSNFSFEGLDDEEVLEICYSDVYDHVKTQALKDVEFFLDRLDKSIIATLERKNNIAGVLDRNLKLLIEKIPDQKTMSKILKDLPKVAKKVFDGMEPQQLELIKTVVKGD
jgi:hypothetical protein